MKNTTLSLLCAVMLAATVSSALAAPPKMSHSHKKAVRQMVTTKDGLKYTDLKVGTGPVAKMGQTVTVQYVGTLTNGQKFDASRDHGQPFVFNLGAHHVIPGWEEGVAGMKVGGTRKLVIPYTLAYGEDGRPPVIPPKATLIFVIDLLDAK